MRFKGNQPIHETPRPDPSQKQLRYRDRRLADAEDFSTIEAIVERENRQADEANVEELERTSMDLWGRSAQQTDGAVPSEPPDTDPLELQPPDNPHRPPKYNI